VEQSKKEKKSGNNREEKMGTERVTKIPSDGKKNKPGQGPKEMGVVKNGREKDPQKEWSGTKRIKKVGV